MSDNKENPIYRQNHSAEQWAKQAGKATGVVQMSSVSVRIATSDALLIQKHVLPSLVGTKIGKGGTPLSASLTDYLRGLIDDDLKARKLK
jgi:hypothetical protein